MKLRQFRLRSLLLLVLLLSVGAGVYRHFKAAEERRDKALEYLGSVGINVLPGKVGPWLEPYTNDWEISEELKSAIDVVGPIKTLSLFDRPLEHQIAFLLSLPDVDRIDLMDADISPKILSQLAKCENLTKLKLESCRFQIDELDFGQHSKLQHLEITGHESDVPLRLWIRSLPNLEFLKVEFLDHIIIIVDAMPKLRAAELRTSNNSTLPRIELATCTQLESLCLEHGWQTTDDPVDGIAHQPRLKSLSTWDSAITKPHAAKFSQYPSLKSLYLFNSSFTPDGMDELARVTTLEELWITRGRVQTLNATGPSEESQDEWQRLLQFKDLESLVLDCELKSASQLHWLAEMRNVKKLDIANFEGWYGTNYLTKPGISTSDIDFLGDLGFLDELVVQYVDSDPGTLKKVLPKTTIKSRTEHLHSPVEAAIPKAFERD